MMCRICYIWMDTGEAFAAVTSTVLLFLGCVWLYFQTSGELVTGFVQF